MVVAVVFWLWYGAGSAYAEQAGLSNWAMHILVPAGIFTISALIAWRHEGIGGTVLILEGVIAFGFIGRAYLLGRLTGATITLMSLTLGLPPLAAGILFFICWRSKEEVENKRGHSATASG